SPNSLPVYSIFICFVTHPVSLTSLHFHSLRTLSCSICITTALGSSSHHFSFLSRMVFKIQLVSTSHGRGLKEALEAQLSFLCVLFNFQLFSIFFSGGTVPSIAHKLFNLDSDPKVCFDADLVFVLCGGNDIYWKGTTDSRTPLNILVEKEFCNLLSVLRTRFSSHTKFCIL
ncbi:unnamed protein product, partial [Owenia fusiformis]